tara:strand:+ start:26876 stop:29041 length:2166 start_codon:yes stop_codon:yes gene_type:complete
MIARPVPPTKKTTPLPKQKHPPKVEDDSLSSSVQMHSSASKIQLQDDSMISSNSESMAISLASDDLANQSGVDISAQIEENTPPDPLIGQLVGNFMIEERIGRGGFGAVYRARQIYLEEFFAIKVLHLNQGTQPEIVKRFQREARALAQLRHEGIVQLADFGMLPEHGFYLVMEYLDGKNLQKRLKAKEVFTMPRIMSFMEQICDILGYVHRKGVIHRDLKPGNIFLLEDEFGTEKVKLIDFGIAALSHDMESITRDGTYLGTAKFASPEQAQGMHELDGRSDLYSLTIILYRMLTGRVPFGGKNAMNIIYHQIHTMPRRPSEVVPHKRWSPLLDNFLRHAFAKNPAARPPDAKSYWELLKKALQHQDQLDRESASHSPRIALQARPELDRDESQLLATGDLLSEESESSVISSQIDHSSDSMRFDATGRRLPGENVPVHWSQIEEAPLPFEMEADDAREDIQEPPSGSRSVVPHEVEAPSNKSTKVLFGIVLFFLLVSLSGAAWWFGVFTNQHTKPSDDAGAKTLVNVPPKRKTTEPIPVPAHREVTTDAGAPDEKKAVVVPDVKMKKPTPLRRRVIKRRRSVKRRVLRRRVRRRRVRRRRVRRRRVVVRRVARRKGACGEDTASHIWLEGRLSKPSSGRPRVKIRRCAGCKVVRKGSLFCFRVPKSQGTFKVHISLGGFQPCVHSMRPSTARKVKWKLAEDDPDGLGVSSLSYCASFAP